MNILSVDFLIFFMCFFVLYWIFQPLWMLQNVFLVVGSVIFISWGSYSNLFVLIAWYFCIYSLSLYWRKTENKYVTNAILCFLIFIFFFVFRFYPSLQENIKSMCDDVGIHLALPMMVGMAPLGLSFYVFHSVSYIISIQCSEVDKDRGALPAHAINGRAEGCGALFLYISFFPSIVSGPINRAANFFPQLMPLQARRILFPKQAVGLVTLAIIKLFFVSDYLDKHLVGPVFSAPSNATPVASLTAVIAYAWQIYMNFSGYTDLVRGMALLLGFNLPENFNAPYLATNISEFWRRWHISLSRFIMDYIYIPLGGNRCSFLRQNLNVMVAMCLSGLWHGVGVNFLIWGVLHGIGLVGLNIFKRIKSLFPESYRVKVPRLLSQGSARFVTFVFLCVTWIFFRATTLDDALTLLHSLSKSISSSLFDIHVVVLWILVILTLCYSWLNTINEHVVIMLQRMPWWTYPFGLAFVFTVVFMFAPAGTPGFIYANF